MKHSLAALVMVGVLSACATTTSSTGRTQYVGAVSEQQLHQLGAQAFTEARQKSPLSTDARQNAYVRCVVDAGAPAPAAQRQLAWETAVFAQDEPTPSPCPAARSASIPACSRSPGARTSWRRWSRTRSATWSNATTTSASPGRWARPAWSAAGRARRRLRPAGHPGRRAAGADRFLLPGSRAQESEADVVGQRLMAQADSTRAPRWACGRT